MTEFVDANVQAALNAQLISGNFGPPIAFPYLPFAPSEGVAYIEAQPIMKAKTQHPGLGYTDDDLNRGIFQVDAVIPDGTGHLPGLRLQAAIADVFKMGTTLIAGSYVVRINAPVQTMQGMKDGAWVRFPVSITFTVIVSKLDSGNDFDFEFSNEFI